jgi:hypothetical protein
VNQSALKGVEFVSDRMPCTVLRGPWHHTFVLNVHPPTQDKTDNVKDNFYEELECVFNKFHQYHIKTLKNVIFCDVTPCGSCKK